MKITVRYQGVEIIYEEETHKTDFPLITMQETKDTVIKAISEVVTQAIRATESNHTKLLQQ